MSTDARQGMNCYTAHVSTWKKYTIGTALFLAVIGLGVSDAFLMERERTAQLFGNILHSNVDGIHESHLQETEESTKNIDDIIAHHGFTSVQTEEAAILPAVLPESTVTQTSVLLRDNDRASFMALGELQKADVYFRALKHVLYENFSSDVTDILDEEREGKPAFSLLTFMDPSLSEERLVFVLSQEHIFEFHVVDGNEEKIWDLIEDLAK
jgi:hypothetical protein